MTTTRPNLRSRMPGQMGWTVLNTPVRLVSITSRHWFWRHFVEGRVAGNARIRHDHVNRAKVRFDLRNARFGCVIIGGIPFVGFDAGFGGEIRCGFVIASIGCRNGIAFCLSVLLEIAAPMPRDPPVTNATLAMMSPSLGFSVCNICYRTSKACARILRTPFRFSVRGTLPHPCRHRCTASPDPFSHPRAAFRTAACSGCGNPKHSMG